MGSQLTIAHTDSKQYTLGRQHTVHGSHAAAYTNTLSQSRCSTSMDNAQSNSYCRYTCMVHA